MNEFKVLNICSSFELISGSLAPQMQAPRGLLRVRMRLVQAPAAFAFPLVQRKLFRPSFKVRFGKYLALIP